MTSLRRGVAAFAIALAVAATTAPALAQMTLFLGGGRDDENDDRRGMFSSRLCILTDRGLRDAIEEEGYEDIFLNAPGDRFVQVRATLEDWVYLLRVDHCTGEIVERERLRRAGS